MRIGRSRGHVIAAALVLLLAAVLGALAFTVAGGLWLIALASLLVVGVVLIDQVVIRWASAAARPLGSRQANEPVDERRPIERPQEPLLPLAILFILAVGLFALAGWILLPHGGNEAAPRITSPTTSAHATSTHATSPQSQAPPGQPSAPTSSNATGSAPAPNSGNRYLTAGSGVHLRSAPATTAPIVATVPGFATPLGLTCYAEGGPVATDPIWYRTSYNGVAGYISALWLNTGSDPSRTGVPHC